MFEIRSVNSSIINDVMTSIDTNNSLKMDTEKTVDGDLGAYHGNSRASNPQHHVRFAANTKPNKPKEEAWNEKRSIQEFPTNAFGQIEFVNEDEGSLKPSK